MAKTAIIQLMGASGDPIGLYQYDPAMFSKEDAIASVERAIENAFQKEEDGELDGDVHTEADDELRLIGISRIFADEATTERL